MKKVLLSVLSLVFVGSLTACQSVPLEDYSSLEVLEMVYASEQVQNDASILELVEAFELEAVTIDAMTEGYFVLDTIPSSADFGLNIEGLDAELIESGSTLAFMLSMSLYNDIVIKVNNPEDVDAVVSALETYQENIFIYPKDMDIKENAEVVVNGNVVALFLNPGYESFQEAFLGLQ